MEHHSMSDKDFHTRYGVTPREVEDALDENRRRVAPSCRSQTLRMGIRVGR